MTRPGASLLSIATILLGSISLVISQSARAGPAVPGQIEIAQNSPSQAEMLFWQTIQNSSNPDDFNAYIQQYPNGAFVALARVKRRQANITQANIQCDREYRECVAAPGLCENAPNDILCETPQGISEVHATQRGNCERDRSECFDDTKRLWGGG